MLLQYKQLLNLLDRYCFFVVSLYLCAYVKVSWSRGTPKSSILMVCFIINHLFLGYPHLWRPPCRYGYYDHKLIDEPCVDTEISAKLISRDPISVDLFLSSSLFANQHCGNQFATDHNCLYNSGGTQVIDVRIAGRASEAQHGQHICLCSSYEILTMCIPKFHLGLKPKAKKSAKKSSA